MSNLEKNNAKMRDDYPGYDWISLIPCGTFKMYFLDLLRPVPNDWHALFDNTNDFIEVKCPICIRDDDCIIKLSKKFVCSIDKKPMVYLPKSEDKE